MITDSISELAAKGRSCFSFEDIEKLTSSSPLAIKAALRRLSKKGEIAMPYRGFYVIIPPEYRATGCLPAEQIDVKRLIEVAELSPVAWVQRVGYLLDLIGEQKKAGALLDYIRNKRPLPTPLMPGVSIKGAKKDSRWQVFVNAEVEPEV